MMTKQQLTSDFTIELKTSLFICDEHYRYTRKWHSCRTCAMVFLMTLSCATHLSWAAFHRTWFCLIWQF